MRGAEDEVECSSVSLSLANPVLATFWDEVAFHSKSRLPQALLAAVDVELFASGKEAFDVPDGCSLLSPFVFEPIYPGLSYLVGVVLNDDFLRFQPKVPVDDFVDIGC